MTGYGGTNSSVRDFVEMLRTELAWYPGRAALVARIVLACMTVVLLAEVFRLPGAILGASFPILISRENPKASRKTAFQIALACTIGTAEVIVGGMLTAGSPFLHVIWVFASLFAAFYAISTLNFMNAALTASALVGVSIRVWDYPIRAEARVELTLYTWLSILLACLVTALIETVFAKKNSTGRSPRGDLPSIESHRNTLKSDLCARVSLFNGEDSARSCGRKRCGRVARAPHHFQL